MYVCMYVGHFYPSHPPLKVLRKSKVTLCKTIAGEEELELGKVTVLDFGQTCAKTGTRRAPLLY